MRSRPGRPPANRPRDADAPGAPARRSHATERDHRTVPGPPSPADTTAVRLAAIGLLVAIIALALGVRAALAPDSGGAGCRTLAWNAVPQASALPAGWSIADSAFTGTGVTSTLSGPPAADGSGASGTVYATVDCFGGDAFDVVARSLAAANAAGQSVATISGLGDEAYSTTDAASGAMAIHFRRGDLVAYTAAVGSVSSSDLQAIATAFDAAMEHAASGAALPTGPAAVSPAAASPAATEGAAASPSIPAGADASPSSSAAAPELEALLPDSVDGTTLTRESAVGVDALGSGQQVRGLGAALRSLGADPANLHLGIAYDDSGTVDLSLLAFGMAGLDTAQLESTILSTWLVTSDPGVKTAAVTLSGHQATAVDYGDQGTISYLLVVGDVVVVIETSDQTLASQAVAALG